MRVQAPHPTHSGCTDHKGCPWEANVPELLGGTVARCFAMPACLVLVPVPHYKQHLSHHNTKLASSKIQHHLLLHLTGEHRWIVYICSISPGQKNPKQTKTENIQSSFNFVKYFLRLIRLQSHLKELYLRILEFNKWNILVLKLNLKSRL